MKVNMRHCTNFYILAEDATVIFALEGRPLLKVTLVFVAFVHDTLTTTAKVQGRNNGVAVAVDIGTSDGDLGGVRRWLGRQRMDRNGCISKSGLLPGGP